MGMIQIGDGMKWTTIDSALHEELMNNKHYHEIIKRIQLIDKELIRLIDAKRRYEEELDGLIKEIYYNENATN
jgi:hypothetical protein